MSTSLINLLTRVDQLIKTGNPQRAEELLSELPCSTRHLAAVIRLRLLLCTSADNWQEGIRLARRIRPDHLPVIRRAAGRFHLAHARMLYQTGQNSMAGKELEKVQRIWPEGWSYVIALLDWSKTRSVSTVMDNLVLPG